MFHKYRCDKGVLWVLLFSLTIGSLKSQVYPFQTFGLEDGLPSSKISDFIQDSRGFYWLAIEGTGLVRYDGHEFVTYEKASRPDWLLVSEIREDEKGNIWVSIENGLLQFDGREFTDFNLPSGLKAKRFSMLDSSVIVVTGNNEIWKLENEIWKQISFTEEVFINDIEVFNESIWIGSDGGLFCLKDSDSKWQQLDTNGFLDLAVDSTKIFALGREQILSFNAEGKLHKRYSESLDFAYVRGAAFCGIKGQSLVLNWDTLSLELNEKNGLPEGSKKCYIDNFGVVWLFGGEKLSKLESQAIRFFGGFNNAIDDQVNGVQIFDNGKLVGGLSSGIVQFKNNRLNTLNSTNGFSFGLTLAIEEFERKAWYGTEAGLVQERNGLYSQVNLPFPGDFIFSLKKAHDKLWLGTGSGLYSYSSGRFENESQKNGLPRATVYSISASKEDNSLWCATYTEGFYRFSGNQWEIIREINGNRFDSLRFSCFTAISKNEIWAGSLTEGVFHLTEKGIEHISPTQINFAEVQSIEADNYGNVWLGTNKGLMRIDVNKNIFQVSPLSSTSSNSASPQAICIKNNKLLLGTSGGMMVIELGKYLRQRRAPGIALMGLKMFLGQNTEWQKYASDSLAFTQVPSDLKLPHTLNFLSFDLSGLTSFENNRLQYRYRLVGQSDEWTYAGSRREAIISNIKPGNYVFEAQASRVGEIWSNNTVKYPFKILRPIWKRWWFISLFSVLTLSLIGLYIYDRVKRINQRLRLENELIEMERKALRLQMNPHFIFNALDSISSFIFKNDPRKAVQYLNNFAKLMRLTLESSMEHLHPVETEVSILKNYLELEKLRFQGKFEYEIELDDEIDYDVGIPPMLIQPHVENAILHGLKPMESDGKLDLRFILDDDMLEIHIEDNGIGRKKAKELTRRKDHRSMATKINKDRLRLLKMAVDQNIEIRILDKEDENKQALGTKVILKLPAKNI